MDSKHHFDYVVVGVGGIGSGALYWLSRVAPNAKILGLEQFELGHVRGGSQDVSRIVRRMYQSAFMADFAKESFAPWKEIEAESGLKLVTQCGGLFWANGDSGFTQSIRETYASTVGTGLVGAELIDGREIRRRWPQINADDGALGLVDPQGGFVDAAMANAAHQAAALRRGAEIWEKTRLLGLKRLGKERLELATSKGTVLCRRVVVAAGAWLNDVLAMCGEHVPLKVTQENVTYFATPNMAEFTPAKMPCCISVAPSGCFYSLPIHGLPGFKIGIDAGGNEVTGDTRTWVPDPERLKLVEAFVKRHYPKAQGRVLENKTCLYTMTYDRTFVVDRLEAAALRRGAEIWEKTRLLGLKRLGEDRLELATSRGTVLCRRVVVAAGAWLNDVLAMCGEHVPLKVTQENVTYFATPNMAEFTPAKMPCCISVAPSGCYYSLPIHGLPGFKIGIDAGGNEVTGDTRTWVPDPERLKLVEAFVKRHYPKAQGRVLENKTCLYTMTYDRTFVVDRLEKARLPEVIVCCGAGHAFKFAALLGKILAELAVEGKTAHDISSFRLERPAVRDANFQPAVTQAKAKI